MFHIHRETSARTQGFWPVCERFGRKTIAITRSLVPEHIRVVGLARDTRCHAQIAETSKPQTDRVHKDVGSFTHVMMHV